MSKSMNLNINKLNQLVINIRNERDNHTNSNKYTKQRITMISMIVKGGNILAIGENDYDRKSYPFKTVNRYKSYNGLHSELAAINQCTAEQLKGSTIVVYGLRRVNAPYSTKPCPSCINAIKAVGIKKIVYYENGIQITAKVNTL
jgi:tRNA(Arg) A34 adenosine deaminase TadA